MVEQRQEPRFLAVGDGSGVEPEDRFYREEVQLASRNRGMPLEALRHPITPNGLHFLLVHFDIPDVGADSWRLSVEGLVAKPLSLTLDDLRRHPAHTIPVTLECAGNGRALLEPRPISRPWLLGGVGTAQWTGVSLRDVLDEAGLRDSAVELVFTGVDRGVQGEQVHAYQRSLSIAEARRDGVLLAYAMNGEPLPPQHGAPLRLLVPGWYGMPSVKWLARIEAVAERFQGYQQAATYRYTQSAEDPGEPVTQINVRSLMIPPGIPDFLTRVRLVEAGPVTLSGRAWAGGRGVARAEVSVDGCASWAEATLHDDSPGPFAWWGWSFRWQAVPGRYTLSVRATDNDGNVQPVDQLWNYQGVGNNMVQRVEVLVE